MSDSGPTTAGSIVGKLKMDRTEWIADKEKTKADAAELGRLRPTITVDTDAKGAVAGLAETAAAADKTVAANDRLGASQERVTRSTTRANEAHSTNISRVGMITTAVALLLPLLPALGSFAVAGAGSLTMMGVAGVLAIFGIKKAMEDGIGAGQVYSSGLQSLKANFNGLAQTSALAMLGSFQAIVREANTEMPLLNRNVQSFSLVLGRSGTALFSGAISGLRVMEPLLIRVGVWVQSLAQGFQSWTTNGGLQKFVSYAIGQLPTVQAVLAALGTGVMHLLQALAPLGTIGLAVLTGISNTISAIPVETLSKLIGAITWGALAWKAWQFVPGMLDAVRTAYGVLMGTVEVSSGPIGWVVAAVGALAAIFAVATVNSQSAARAQQDYTAAVQADTGVIGDNIKAAAAKALQDAGALKAYQALGGSVNDLTEATLGNAAAQARVQAVIAKANATLEEGAGAAGGLSKAQLETSFAVNVVTSSMNAQSGAIKDQIDAFNVFQASVGGATIATMAQQRAMEANAGAAGVTAAAYLSALSGQQDTQLQTEKTTAAMYLQNDAAGLLKQSLDLLNGKAISYAQAQNQFDSGLSHLTSTTIQATDENGNLVNSIDQSRAALDSNTASGTEARGELINLVTSAQSAAQAFRDQGGSAEETKSKLDTMKQSIIENAVEQGLNRDAVTSFVNALYTVPASIPPTKAEFDAAQASADLAIYQTNLANIPRQVSTVMTVDQIINYAPGVLKQPEQADGGTAGLADGGSAGGTVRGPGSAASDEAGLYRLANGEEVISNKKGQADKFRGVLKMMNAGFDVSAVASRFSSLNVPGRSASITNNGGTSIDQSRHISAPITINEAVNPAQAASEVARRLNHLTV